MTTTNLDELRAAIADKCARGLGLTQSYVDEEIRKAWLKHITNALDELIEHLAGVSGEFDKLAAVEQAKHEDSDGFFGFLTGAEWQFDQDRARIGLAEMDRDNYRRENQELRSRDCIDSRILADRDDQIKSLEARLAFACERLEVREAEITATEALLAESERECEQQALLNGKGSERESGLRAKLSSTEALYLESQRINEEFVARHREDLAKLAAAETSIKQGKQLNDADNKRIYELEARIKGLEAELLHSRRES